MKYNRPKLLRKESLLPLQNQFEQQLFSKTQQQRPIIEEQRKRYAQRKNKKESFNDNYNNKPIFLFNSKQSHPIIEYIPSEDESTSLTPSFVLEVTWPRIILFYHPSSPRCKAIQPVYVSLARGIKRRSSRMPVEFHAVNCGIHRDVCEQGFNVQSVPIIIGLKSGRIDWAEVSIPFEDALLDVEHEVEYLANEMRIPLDAVKGVHAEAAFAMQSVGGDGESSYADNNNAPSGQLLAKSMHIPLSDQVFHDATASFLETLTSSLYGIALGGALPRDTSKALSEFIDLIRWAYPPESKLHNLAEDIMLDFENSIKSEVALRKVILRHVNLEIDSKWCSRCSGADAIGGYECGLWSLVHILSIGVAERHTSVVGADERVSVMYAGKVMRTFIDNFYTRCSACRNLWIRLYDDSISTAPEGDGDIDDWRHLAIWIWEIHNEITVRRDQSAGKGYKGLDLRMAPSISLWPTKTECPKCWQSLNDDTGVAMNMDSYDSNEVYEQLKKTYWPSGIHNNRLIVLDRKRGHGLFAKRLRARLADHEWPISLVIIHILLICLIFRVMVPNLCGRLCRRGRGKHPVEMNRNYPHQQTGRKPGWNKPSHHSALKSRSCLSLHSSEQAFLLNSTETSPFRTRMRH
jgi:hypothetical protein